MIDRVNPIRLVDYRAPAWTVTEVALTVDLDVTRTRVHATLRLRQNGSVAQPLHLDGEGLELQGIRLNGHALAADEYRVDDNALVIAQVSDDSVLETDVTIDPSANSALSGLYLSGSCDQGFLLTQCEAQGFRRITYFPDRPDVLARYQVTLRADPQRFPVLLSNGNPSGSGRLADGRHWASWTDPHPKPSYLFALVAGRLESIEQVFTTAEGRAVVLRIHAEADAIARCGYAMDALVRAMRWDEEHYGRCYDLDVFQIVATHDFNMGAMENKGLNIFNAKYLLADPQRSSDDDYRHIEAIVAHEYFHNWTGNRVTCRDWFQLSLKEGLTVYREQQFSAQMNSPTLRRIDDVQILRRAQFPEDAGPLAHAVRPAQYSAIDNFYTATVYDKGAELIRMIAGRLGERAWRCGMDEYFRRHDGHAATLEQFLAALGEVNGVDLSVYLTWFSQAGTPSLSARSEYDDATQTFSLHLAQHTAPTPDAQAKVALPIPVRLALLGADGNALPLGADSDGEVAYEQVVELVSAAQTFSFSTSVRPRVASLLRGFSAPVQLNTAHNGDDLAFLLRHESDGFNRWEAAQQLARLAFDAELAGAADTSARQAWVGALVDLVDETTADPALLAELLALPDLLELAERCEPLDPCRVYAARESLEVALAQRLDQRSAQCHAQLLRQERGELDGNARGRRRLLNRCLSLWARHERDAALEMAATRYVLAPNMTERMGALGVLAIQAAPQAETALQDFGRRYADDAVTLDKWFALQAAIPRADTVERVHTLMAHPRFSLRNPNRALALLSTFSLRNPLAFHRVDGAGYALLEQVLGELDHVNPATAARLASNLKGWSRLEPDRRERMRLSLERLAGRASSNDLSDILRRTLG